VLNLFLYAQLPRELSAWAAKKLAQAECLFGFSQHKMHICDLSLRNCQTSNMRSLRLVNRINSSKKPARGLTPVVEEGRCRS
jgi:hypothetical protein